MENSRSIQGLECGHAQTGGTVSSLTLLLAICLSLSAARAENKNGAPSAPPTAPAAFVTVEHLGQSESETAMRDGQLLSLRRKTDPFNIPIRGPFKGLPPAAEQPLPAVPTVKAVEAPSLVAPIFTIQTLEKAIQELTIGAVDVTNREILIGPRSIREGDLLVLESGGQQFVVWLQSVSLLGATFCDTDLQKHVLKSFDAAPKELPDDFNKNLEILNQNTPP